MNQLNIDWQNLPYKHESHPKHFTCIFNPPTKISLPELIMEMCLYNRERFIKGYKKIPRGDGWSVGLGSSVRLLMLQAHVICSYFPSPQKDALVPVAFKNYFRSNRVFKLGTYKKNRENISIDEKELVKGVTIELRRLQSQRDIFSQIAPKTTPQKPAEEITFSLSNPTPKKGSIASLIELENRLKSTPPKVDTTEINNKE